MRSSCCLVMAVALAAVLMPDQAIAQAAMVPTQDIANARDNPLLRTTAASSSTTPSGPSRSSS